jgi:hypothetical protein
MNIDTLVFVALAALLIIAGPLATIWAVNTLFPVANIPYTVETWFAAVILGSLLSVKVGK